MQVACGNLTRECSGTHHQASYTLIREIEHEDCRELVADEENRENKTPGRILQHSPREGLSFVDVVNGLVAGDAEHQRLADNRQFFCGVYRSGKCIIIPDRKKDSFHPIELWDVFIALLLVVTVYFVPYDVAFLNHESIDLFEFNLFLDVCFTIDIVMQFFIAYPNHHENLSSDLWETDPCKIARRYCAVPFSEKGRAGWFWIDAMTILPGWVDAFMKGLPSGGKPTTKVLTLFRAFRLIRMLRMIRFLRLVERWHAFFGFPYFWIELQKFFFVTTVSVHWMACAWVMSEGKVLIGYVSYHAEADQNSWLSALISAKGDPCHPEASQDPSCVYVLALYWAGMTLTTVGYGDIIPQNQTEYIVCTVCMILSGYIWAYVVGAIVNVLASLDPYGVQFKQNMDDLNEMMQNNGLPADLQVRLRSYMNESKHIPQIQGQRNLIESNISPGLQQQIAKHSFNSELLRGVYWARELEEDALLAIVTALRPQFFGPHEVMHLQQTMVIICKGIAAIKGRVISRGYVWGHESILLQSENLLTIVYPRTLSYVDVLCLHRESLMHVCQIFPSVDKRLRRAQIRTAVYRAFCIAAYNKRSGNPLRSVHRMRTFTGRDNQAAAAAAAASVAVEAAQTREARSTSKESSPSEKRSFASSSFNQTQPVSVDLVAELREFKKEVLQKQNELAQEVRRISEKIQRV